MKINKSFILQLLLFGISPIAGALSSAFFSMNKKLSPFVIAVSVALIFVYMPLMYDVSASFFAYFDYQSGNIVSQLHSINILAGVLVKTLGLDYFYTVFLVCSISLYFWFSVYTIILKNTTSNLLPVTLFFLFLSLLSYKELMDLNRSFFAYSTAMYSIFMFHKGECGKLKFRTLLIISFLIHPSSFIIIFAYFIAKYIPFSRGICLIGLLVSLGVGMKFELFLSVILPFIPAGTFLQTYMSNSQWGIVTGFEMGKLILFAVQSLLLISALLFVMTKPNDRLAKTFFLIVIMFLVFIKFRVFGERFFLAATICIPFAIHSIQKFNGKLLVLIMCAFIKFFSYNIYIFGYIFSDDFNYVVKNVKKRENMMLKPLYMPTVILINIKYFGYSNEFIFRESIWKIDQYNNALTGQQQ
jgi:hypothetical protein